MLQLTRLSGPAFALNPDLIERAEATPDTVVTLVNGSKYVIRESLDELVELVRRYRADIVRAAQDDAAAAAHAKRTAAAVKHADPMGTTMGTVVPLRTESGEL